MKTPRFLALALLLFIGSSSFGQIVFQENVPFQTVLDQAKKENKLVFMDCYTTWCGPCKWLVKNVFADQKVADKYNSQFINFKSDMEKGEGLDIAKRYQIQMYPTLLWLNGDGEVVFVVVGTNTVEAFLEFADNLKEDENLFPNMVKKYNDGNRDPEFLKKLANAAVIGYDNKSSTYSETYLNAISKEEWGKEENIGLLYAACQTFDAKITQYLLSNPSSFDAELVESIKAQCINNEVKTVIESKSEVKLKEFLTTIDKYSPGKIEQKQEIELYFYKAVGNKAMFDKLASGYLKNSNNSNLLNSYAWDRFEHETDVQLLKEAILWAEKSVKLDKNYANTDTLGQLYKKVGNKKKAEKWLKESKRLEEKEI